MDGLRILNHSSWRVSNGGGNGSRNRGPKNQKGHMKPENHVEVNGKIEGDYFLKLQ